MVSTPALYFQKSKQRTEALRKQEIFLHLKNFLVEEFEKDPAIIELDKELTEIGMDSLDAFDFFTMINDNYSIDLDQRELMTLKTVDDVVELIMEKTKA